MNRIDRLGAVLAFLLVFLLFTSWLPGRIYFSLFESSVLILSCWWAFTLIRGRASASFPWTLWAMAAPPAFGLMQLASNRTVYVWRTATATLDWLVYATIGWLSFLAFAGARGQERFRKGLMVVGITVALLSLLHWYTSSGLLLWMNPNPYAIKTTFPLLNHSHFAALMELAMAAALWEGLRDTRPFPIYGIAAALMVFAVFATGSRSGSAIILMEMVAAILLNLRLASRKTQIRRRALAIVIVALALVGAFGWQALAGRLASPPRDDLRPRFVASTVEMIRAKPLSGFGLGTWDTVYPAYASLDLGMFVEHAHNDWLEWAAEGGVPLSIVMLLLAVFALRRSWTQPWCLGIVAVFTHAVVEFPLHKPALLALQFAAIGCLSAHSDPQIDVQ